MVSIIIDIAILLLPVVFLGMGFFSRATEKIVAVLQKRRRKPKTYTVSCSNEIPPGRMEKALASIYTKKFKNGALDLQQTS